MLFVERGDGTTPLSLPSAESGANSTERQVKVLILIPTLEVGGAEMDLVRTLPFVNQTRLSPVVCPLRARGPLASRLIDAGVKLIDLEVGFHSDIAFSNTIFSRLGRSCLDLVGGFPGIRFIRRLQRQFRLCRAIVRLIRREEYDIVHAILPYAYFTAVMSIALTKRLPLIMSRLSLNNYQKDHRLFGWFERQFFHRRVDWAIGNCRAILDDLKKEGIPQRKLILIHNGIDVQDVARAMIDRSLARDRLGVPRTAFVLSVIANLHYFKGHADLLKALHLVTTRLPKEWVLLVAGRDSDDNLSQLTRLADELCLSGHVRFLGQYLDVPTILSAADLHVSASHHEGFPNNILEAMAAGLPVVATAVGGVCEQVVHGVTGLLVPPKDCKLLGEALCGLAVDRERRTEMGRAARAYAVDRFPIMRTAKLLEQAYLRAARPHVNEAPDIPHRLSRQPARRGTS